MGSEALGRRVIGWVALSTSLVAGTLGAQAVRGTVTERASQSPIAGAVVFLLDARQSVVARDLTTETGAYRLMAPGPGVFRVRMLRIGFRPVLSEPVQLIAESEVTLPLVIENVPVALNAVRVERRANCSARDDITPAYNAWNEVSTALTAALLSTRLRGTRATVVKYDRWTEPGSEVVLRQGANVQSGLPGMPWRSVPADSLHRVGFVVQDAGNWFTFHAPDLDVLLSDTFLEDHCLQLHGVANGEIAIEFVPARDRERISEIRGFVWLSAATLELKRLQFRYVNVLREYEDAGAGGELGFLKLRNGSWIISRWQIRMPTAFRGGRSESYGVPGGSGRTRIRATEMKTTGGDLLRVVSNGDTLFTAPPRDLVGQVLDSATNRPIPGARVLLAGTGYSAMANELGRFSIDDVLPGAYRIRAYTPDLDSLAAFHEAPIIFAERLPSVDVRVPSREQLLGRWCPDAQRGTREVSGLAGILFGTVRHGRDSTPVPRADILVEWQDAVMGQSGLVIITDRAVKVETDAQGVYRACGPPVDHKLRVATEFDGRVPPVEVRIGANRVQRLDFWILDGQRAP
jgi:hypothetical protein